MTASGNRGRVAGVIACLWLAAAGAHAQSNAPRAEWQVQPGAKGPNRLVLSPEVIGAGSPFRVTVMASEEAGTARRAVAEGGLGDLRLFDRGGREVPYLLIAPPAREHDWRRGQVLPVKATKVSSGFEVDLGAPAMVDRLRIDGLPAPFLKRFSLEGSGDRAHWVTLVAEGTLFDLPAARLQQKDVSFDSAALRYFRVTWDDRNSGRVPLPKEAAARLAGTAPPTPVLRAPVPHQRLSSEPGVSRYRLSLPGFRLPITAIELTVAPGPVNREARVIESSLQEGDMRPRIVGRATLRRATSGSATADALDVSVTQPVESELQLVIDDGDNPPLDVTGITAVFAELPWIYFEAVSADPLTARLGDPTLTSPRYDLEAMRESAATGRAAVARWGASARVDVPVAASADASSLRGAAIDAAPFRYARDIAASGAGLTVITLDPATLAHSRLADVRIVAAGARQVPYLLERRDEPLSVELPALEAATPTRNESSALRTGKGGRSFYRVRFPYAGLSPARLVLATLARVFDRSVQIVLEDPSQDGRRAPQVVSGRWVHASPDTDAPPAMFDLGGLRSTSALVVVDEGDNSPLPLGAPKLLLSAYRVRFFNHPGTPLTLVYGHRELDAPHYDLKLLSARLTGATAAEAALGPERTQEEKTGPVTSVTIFWLVLIVAVVILFGLIVRLLGRQPSAP